MRALTFASVMVVVGCGGGGSNKAAEQVDPASQDFCLDYANSVCRSAYLCTDAAAQDAAFHARYGSSADECWQGVEKVCTTNQSGSSAIGPSCGPGKTPNASAMTCTDGLQTQSCVEWLATPAGTGCQGACSAASAGGTAGTAGGTGTGAGGSGGTSSGGTATTGGSGGQVTTAGSTSGGTGGTGGSGGAGGSGGGAAGTGGSGGSGGGGMITVADLLGTANMYGEKLMDSFILFPCYSKAQQDCITVPSGMACPNQDNTAIPYEDRGVQTHEYFNVGGTPGTMYLATIHVDGITEAKYYEKGTCDGSDTPTTCAMGRAAGLGDPPAANTNTFQSCTAADPAHCTDAWYTGGDPIDAEHYNVYKLTVYKYPNAAGGMPGQELQHYYMNSFPVTASAYEDHKTYYVSYTHTFPVMGGGIIEYKTGDQNCHAIDNCGPGRFTTDCTATDKNAGRSLPAITVPTMYLGKTTASINLTNGANQPYHSHILHITFTAVKPM